MLTLLNTGGLIMATALSLSPLFRQSVGFDRFNDLFETLNADNDHKNVYPPYDIIKNGENQYQIVMAVAGFQEADITITLENDTLKVSGKSEPTPEESTVYLHRGIARRAFERSYRLADHMKVQNASLTNGLLSITIEREIPAEKKPQVIAINSAN
jgi:molecular chaperone IbpA